MSSASDSFSTNSPAEQRNHDVVHADSESHQSGSEGVLANVKEQLNSVTGGRSISEIGSEVSSVASEKVQDAKETVLPVAEEAIHTVQAQIRSLAGSRIANDFFSLSLAIDPTVDAAEQQRVDQLDTERICDFLREKHMSTKPPPSTN
ncbi:hypothetical protein N7481_000669 [Penicillium waksmanii]|uniref:uncharacterized protein n=1 Tax=Penicillium waksmanii TaxID=69791 RepID=UPI002546BB80|nr:uncharacterized protein N7481_000669 [Penicillium waksmanii]KAJ6000260.1 hypothetical protein N7481_000669 [Penicillium waksmanii]